MQGLNYIAGLVLVVVEDEENAFWLMTVLVSQLLPQPSKFLVCVHVFSPLFASLWIHTISESKRVRSVVSFSFILIVLLPGNLLWKRSVYSARARSIFSFWKVGGKRPRRGCLRTLPAHSCWTLWSTVVKTMRLCLTVSKIWWRAEQSVTRAGEKSDIEKSCSRSGS